MSEYKFENCVVTVYDLRGVVVPAGASLIINGNGFRANVSEDNRQQKNEESKKAEPQNSPVKTQTVTNQDTGRADDVDTEVIPQSVDVNNLLSDLLSNFSDEELVKNNASDISDEFDDEITNIEDFADLAQSLVDCAFLKAIVKKFATEEDRKSFDASGEPLLKNLFLIVERKKKEKLNPNP